MERAMTKPVQGYLAEDGTFFESKSRAELHDAEMSIRAYCVSHKPPIDAEKLLVHIEALADVIQRYNNANAQVKAYIATEAQAGERETNPEIKAPPAPLLKQSPDGHKSVSNVGRRS
jgi:hypothetical protein